MYLEEMTAVELLASKKIDRLYGYPMFVAMAENKNDLHERTYDGKSLRTACERLIDLLTEVSQAHLYNFFGIIGKELPYSVPELTEIYSLLYDWGRFTEEHFKDAWAVSFPLHPWVSRQLRHPGRQFDQKTALSDVWEAYSTVKRQTTA